MAAPTAAALPLAAGPAPTSVSESTQLQSDVMDTTLVPTLTRMSSRRDGHGESAYPTVEASTKDEGSPTEPQASLRGGKAFLLITCVCMTTIVNTVGNQGVLMALPEIGADLDIDEANLQWITNCYSLTFGCFLLLSGRIADIFGRKRCYVAGVVFFAIWMLACGFMKNKYGFLVGRALAGMGASLSIPSAIGIVAETFEPGPYRSMAYAALGGGAPIGSAIGTTLGGVLTQYASWRAVCWLVAGLAIAPPTLGFFVIKDIVPSPKDVDLRVDVVGAVLSTVGLVLLLFVLSDGPTAPNGWKTPYIIALLIVSVIILCAFVYWQHYMENVLHRPPLMRLALFTRGNGKLAVIYAVIFFLFAGFMAFFFLSDIFLQQYLGLDALHTAIRYLPTAPAGIFCNILVGLLARVIPGQGLQIIGLCGSAIANLLFAVIPSDGGSTYWSYQFVAMVLTVAGADFCMSSGMIFISKLVLPQEQSVAGALFQTQAQLGGSFGLTICTIVYTTITQKETVKMGYTYSAAQDASAYPPSAFYKGLKAGFWTAFSFCMVALLFAVVFLRGMGYIEDRQPKLGKEDGGDSESAFAAGDVESRGGKDEKTLDATPRAVLPLLDGEQKLESIEETVGGHS